MTAKEFLLKELKKDFPVTPFVECQDGFLKITPDLLVGFVNEFALIKCREMLNIWEEENKYRYAEDSDNDKQAPEIPQDLLTKP